MLALESDLQQPPRDSVALMDQILTWRLPAPPPPLIIQGKSVAEMKLETAPDVTRLSSGVVGVKMVITEVANCGERGEKGELLSENDRVNSSMFRNPHET